MPNRIKAYAGFTMGPILDVLSHSKKTRELWFGSYFFSWYMEVLINNFKEIHGDVAKFLIPYLPDDSSSPSLSGRFLDRFVMSSSKNINKTADDIKNANNTTVNFFAKEIAKHAENELIEKFIGEGNTLGNEIFNILSQYLQPRFIVLSASDVPEKDIINTIYKALDTSEEYSIIEPGISVRTCDRCKFLPGIGKVKEPDKILTICPICFMKLRSHTWGPLLARIPPTYINYYNTNHAALSYPSLSVISAKDIFENADKDIKTQLYKISDDDDAFEKIETILKQNGKPNLKTYHKYYAIVQADGDSLGEIAKKIDDPNELSKRLYNFSSVAEGLISKYGGVPVYLGGDDILAFMPIFYKNKTILDFVHCLQKKYSNCIGREQATATLSFGIAMAYHRFPLANSLKKAQHLLFDKAKNKRTEKNCLGLSLIRHSGSELSLVLECDSKRYEAFSKLLEALLENNEKIPRRISYKLAQNRQLLNKIPDSYRLQAFFDNVIRDETHGTSFTDGLDKVFNLMNILLFESEKKGEELIEKKEPEGNEEHNQKREYLYDLFLEEKEEPEEKRNNIINEIIQLLQFLRFLTEE